jgi:hypothetical protein
MEEEADISDEPHEKIKRLREKSEAIREKMEIEALAFIEAAKSFTFEWIRREMETSILSSYGISSPDNLELDSKKLNRSRSDLKELPLRISDIVEAHLNGGDYWVHRNELLQVGISRDYLDFKKEKIRRELTLRIRMILGCTAEIFWKPEEEEPENKIWVKELGRKKYVCFLRFSDEMTESLNHYFAMLEELFILDYEMKEEMLRINGKPS